MTAHHNSMQSWESDMCCLLESKPAIPCQPSCTKAATLGPAEILSKSNWQACLSPRQDQNTTALPHMLATDTCFVLDCQT